MIEALSFEDRETLKNVLSANMTEAVHGERVRGNKVAQGDDCLQK